MLITGEFLSAQEAKAEGLINKAVPAEALDEAVWKMARTIAQKRLMRYVLVNPCFMNN